MEQISKVASFKDRLKQEMDNQGLKQVDLLNWIKSIAEARGVSINKAYISQYLKGRNKPNGERLNIIATILGVTESWLTGNNVPKHNSKENGKLTTADLADKNTLFTYQGRPIPPEDLKVIRRFMNGKDD